MILRLPCRITLTGLCALTLIAHPARAQNIVNFAHKTPVPTRILSTNRSSLAFKRINLDVPPLTELQSFFISNRGTSPLNVTVGAPTGTGSSSFVITAGGGTLTPVAPGATSSVTIEFAPVIEGTFSAAISVASDANKGKTTRLIKLSGSATTPKIQPAVRAHEVSSTTFTLNGDEISSIASGDMYGDGSRTIVIGSATYSTNYTTTSRFSALKLTSDGQISDVSNTLLDQSKPGPVLSRKIVIGDFTNSGHLGFFGANTGPDIPPFSGEPNSLFLWQNGTLVNQADLLPNFDAYTHTAATTGTNLLVGVSPPYAYLGSTEPPQYSGPNVVYESAGNQGAGYYAGPYMLNNLSYNNNSLPETILPPAGDYVTEAEFLNISGGPCPDLVLGLNVAEDAIQYVPAPSNCNGDYSQTPVAINPGAFGSQATITLGLASTPLTNSGRNDIIDVSTSQTPFYGIGKLQILINNGNGQFTDETANRLPSDQGISASDNAPEYPGETEFWYRWVYTADLENRGCQDIVTWGGHGNMITKQQTIFMNNCDGSNTFRHPTAAEAPMPPYDLYPVSFNGTTYLVQFQYQLGSTPPFTVTATVFKW